MIRAITYEFLTLAALGFFLFVLLGGARIFCG